MGKKTLKLTDLKQDNANYNKHTSIGMGLLKKSISKFGFVEAGLISEDDVICSGNARQETAVNIGMQDVEIIDIDGTKPIYLRKKGLKSGTKEFKELGLALNAVGKANVVFDVELVETELGEAVCEEWGVDPILKLEAKEDDFNGIKPNEAITLLGDLYELNEHRLLCGDSTQTDTFKKLFNGQFADMVITDPPYNVAYEGKTKDKLKIINDKQKNSDFYQFLFDFYTALGEYTKPGGVWYVWHADSEGANFRMAMANSGIMVRQCLIWVKNSMVMGRQDYQWKHEPCLYGWKEGASHGWYNDRKQTTILNFERPQKNTEHQTMKPVQLFSYQIGNSSKQGDIVADGFGGSGTTIIACDQMKRKGYLVELDTKYCDVIVSRYIKHRQSIGGDLLIKRNGKQLTDNEIIKYIENTNA